jgi:hypothetical protein
MVKMVGVESSNIKQIGYDEERKELFVRFLNEALYVYEKVPETVFSEFLKAESKGKFLIREIKNVYTFRKLVDVGKNED